jgi:type I restriction-modification system DNA methylase subunit
MGKSYVCQDCKIEFDQKSHYDRHANKKIPCVLKDKPLKDVINDTVSKQVSKIIKEENKNIIISSSNVDSDEEVVVKSTKKKIVKKEEKSETDYSYLRLPDNEEIFQLENDENEKNIKPILKMIDKAHDILFRAENIVGQKALQIIMSLLFLKLIQPYLSNKKKEGKIDLLNKKYYLEKYEDDENLDKILGYFKDLSTLTCQPLKTIRNDSNVDAIKQMGEILKRHPITKMIYSEANFIKVREASTIQTLINDFINKINFTDFNDNEDVIGEIYEHILGKYVKNNSKELGQFFTPRKLMKLILSYKKDRINELFSKINKKDTISICDPCMGTAGWLVSGYNMFNDDFKNRLNVSGGEVEPETFQYSLMNIILTLHRFPDDIQCNSSLTHVNKNKHNLILTNPPFNSSKQIKFEQIEKNFKNDEYTTDNKININDIYELKKDDPPIQFLELDTYKLEENGMCIIVLPYGEFFSGNSFSKTRTHFLKTVNITDIILVPGGIFTHTGIKTCVMIYEKNKKGTENINFVRINQECDSIEKITSVDINDIRKEQSISWYHTDYLNDNLISKLSKNMNNFDWIEFGDIFTLEKGKIQSSKIEEDDNGKYPVISKCQNQQDWKYTNEFKIDGENLFIFLTSNTTKLGITYYNGKCISTDLVSKLIIIDKYQLKINIKYIFYYLKSIKNHIEDIYLKGSCHQSLDQKNFNRMKIPIPPLDIQNKLINKLDSSNDKVKYMKLIVDSMKQDIETFFELTIKIENKNSETKWIEFGEVFTLEKGKLQSSKVEEDEEGTGVFINWSLYDNYKKISKYSLSGENLFISTTMPNGKDGGYIVLKYYNGDCDYGDLMSRLIFDYKYKNKINIKYIYHFLNSIKKHIETVYEKGSCNKSLDLKNFNRMKIQIPSIKQQNKCIEKINEMEETIKRWENDIDNILNNGSNKFLEYLECESIKYEKDKDDNEELETNSNIVKIKIKSKTKTAII